MYGELPSITRNEASQRRRTHDVLNATQTDQGLHRTAVRTTRVICRSAGCATHRWWRPPRGTPFKATAYERHATFQFSFASLLVTIALIAVLLGVFRLVAGLGVLLAIIVAPAWIPTCVTVAFRSSDRGQVSLGQKAGIFAASLGHGDRHRRHAHRGRRGCLCGVLRSSPLPWR